MIFTISSADNIYACTRASDSQVDSFIQRFKNALIWHKKLVDTETNLIFQLKSIDAIENIKIQTINDDDTLSKCIYSGITYITLRYNALFSYKKLSPEIIKNFDLKSSLDIQKIDTDLFPPYLVVHISDNVTYNLYTDRYCKFLGKSPIGTRFVKNLINYDFVNIDEMLNAGDNSTIDILISDIYKDGYDAICLPPDCLAASLAKLTNSQSTKKEDIFKSVIIAFAIDIAHHSIIYSNINKVHTVVYIGDLVHSENVCKMINFASTFMSGMSINCVFFKNPQYIAPLGIAERSRDI